MGFDLVVWTVNVWISLWWHCVQVTQRVKISALREDLCKYLEPILHSTHIRRNYVVIDCTQKKAWHMKVYYVRRIIQQSSSKTGSFPFVQFTRDIHRHSNEAPGFFVTELYIESYGFVPSNFCISKVALGFGSFLKGILHTWTWASNREKVHVIWVMNWPKR